LRQRGRNKGLVALVVGTLGVLGIGCNADGDQDDTRADSTSSTAPTPSSTAASPPPGVVAVAYTRTYVDEEQNAPPEKFHAEVSLDGASFRMTADDGSRDLAYDAASGTAYEWGKAQDGSLESYSRFKGLASGGPDHHGLTDGPDLPLAVFVRTLGRTGDSRVTTVTSHGRPAWHYDGPMAGDVLGGEPVEDHVVADVDQASGVLLLQIISAKGKPTRRIEATSIESRPTEDRSRYRPDPPATATIDSEEDHGFQPMTLDELASAAGYDVLVPGAVPAGFGLDEVLFNAERQLYTGAEALNPAPARVTSLRWQGPNGTSFTVTLRPENGDPKAKQDGAEWSDPFGSEGTVLEATKVSLPLEGRKALAGELILASPAAPHLWGVTGDLVVTVDGDLDADGLRSVAGSLRKHPKPASSAAPVKCPQIGFTPNSDDVAADIEATGVDCDEASALVRKVRDRRGVVGEQRNFTLPPWSCRAARGDTALESTAYRCDDGARRVTWQKT
jgi:hypothetical protein